MKDWDHSEYFGFGIIGAIIAGIVLGMGLTAGPNGWLVFFGAVLAAVAQVMLLVGIISLGVKVGMRAADVEGYLAGRTQ